MKLYKPNVHNPTSSIGIIPNIGRGEGYFYCTTCIDPDYEGKNAKYYYQKLITLLRLTIFQENINNLDLFEYITNVSTIMYHN